MTRLLKSVRLVSGRALLVLSIAAPHLLHAQTTVESNLPGAGFDEPPSAQQSTAPTLQVYSRETVVDVLVTDDKGQPVRGLTRSDFTIEEDNHPQPIRSFSEYSKTTHPLSARTLPPHTYTNTNALPASGPVQVFYFILPPPTGLAGSLAQGAILVRAKKYIADYLRTMPDGTQVAIFTFVSDRGLQLVQGFTTDGALAAAAVDKMVVQRFGNSGGFDPLAAANQIAAYLAGIHGRKNLIWIGSPPNIMRDGGYSWYHPPEAPDMVYVRRLMDLYDLFTRAQIAIYPFDPNGVVGLGLNNLRVEEIAAGTGGAAIYNTNDFQSAVAKIRRRHLALLHPLLHPSPPQRRRPLSRHQNYRRPPRRPPRLPHRLQRRAPRAPRQHSESPHDTGLHGPRRAPRHPTHLRSTGHPQPHPFITRRFHPHLSRPPSTPDLRQSARQLRPPLQTRPNADHLRCHPRRHAHRHARVRRSRL